jgi:hypothetical protein
MPFHDDDSGRAKRNMHSGSHYRENVFVNQVASDSLSMSFSGMVQNMPPILCTPLYVSAAHAVHADAHLEQSVAPVPALQVVVVVFIGTQI